jgi:hypothetical protein
MTTSRSDEEARAASFVEAARVYSRLGWALVPLDGKKPRGRVWQTTQPCEPEYAAGLWSRLGKRSNLGVVLGTSGLAVLEYDTDPAREKLLELFGGEWPLTSTVNSGGRSRHFYFLDDGYKAASRDGLELRCGAQQCVLPPSEHPETGRLYEWQVTPLVVPPARLPEGVLAYFTTNNSRQKADVIGDEIHEPGRHKALLSLAGSMRRRGMTAEEIAVALLAVNASRCKPPLPEREVVELAADVARRYAPPPPDVEQERIEREAERILAGDDADDGATDQEARRDRRTTSPLIVKLVEFLGGDKDDAAWLVDHLAAKAALVLVAGLPKVGKSTFVYGMLGALTGPGDRFLGLPAATTSVLLMTEEPPATVEEKVDRFGLDDDRVYILSKRRVRSGRKWAKVVEAAAAFCREHPEIGICVVDVLDKFADWDSKRSEADTGVIRETIDPLYELLDLGVCVILITHQRKAEGEYGLRVRGGTALVGSADVVVEVERKTGLSRESRVVKIVSRFVGAPDEIAVELTEDGWRSLGDVAAAARRSRLDDVLDLVGDEPQTREELLAAGNGISEATLRRRLVELVRLALVERVGEGTKGDPYRWQLTEAGRIFRVKKGVSPFPAADGNPEESQ